MVETVDNAGKKIWSCSLCGYISNKTTNMYKHIERKHLNVNLYCEVCNRVFKSRDDLNVHKRLLHHEGFWVQIKVNQNVFLVVCLGIQQAIEENLSKLETGMWVCHSCDFTSKSKQRAFEHYEAKHLTTSGYSCPLCNKFCPTSSSLRNHNDRHHKQKRLFWRNKSTFHWLFFLVKR